MTVYSIRLEYRMQTNPVAKCSVLEGKYYRTWSASIK